MLKTPPGWLAAAYLGEEKTPGLQFALNNDWVRQPPPALRTQLVRAPLGCQSRPSPGLRRNLSSASQLNGIDGKHFTIDSIQPISFPGQANCVWMISGGGRGGREFMNDESFRGGVNRLTPCTEGSPSAAVWNDDHGVWIPIKDTPGGTLVPVRYEVTKKTVFIATGADYAGCGHASGTILIPHFGSDGSLRLSEPSVGDPILNALLLQCDVSKMEKCFGIGTELAHPADPVGLHEFLALAWVKEKDEFLAAIDLLDRPVLAGMRDQHGIFSHWLHEALRRISASPSFTVQEKRHRVAWVLAQRKPQADFSSDTLDKLVEWLPAEDWGPILSRVQCNIYQMESLIERASTLNLKALQRRFRSSLAAGCESETGRKQ